MITGIVATDAANHSAIKFNLKMQSPLTGSFWFMRGICEGTNVVTDYETWKRLSVLEEIPSNIPVFINVSVEQVRDQYPYVPIVVVGNTLVEKNLDLIDRLIQISYHEDDVDLITAAVFPFPGGRNTLAVTPYYHLYDYTLKEKDDYAASLNLATTNSAFAVPNTN